MLPKKYRVSENNDFSRIFAKGHFFGHPLLYVKFLPNNLNHSRFGFVVGVKLFKRAVKRNRVRRVMREVVHSNLDKIPSGFDVIVGSKSQNIYEASFSEIEKGLIPILIKMEERK